MGAIYRFRVGQDNKRKGDKPMPTYQTRKESYMAVDKRTRYRQIFGVLHGAMTAREVARAIGYYERNAAAPRLTELVQAGLVDESGTKTDDLTGRTVTMYTLNQTSLDDMIAAIDRLDDRGQSVKFIAFVLGVSPEMVRAVYDLSPHTKSRCGWYREARNVQRV